MNLDSRNQINWTAVGAIAGVIGAAAAVVALFSSVDLSTTGIEPKPAAGDLYEDSDRRLEFPTPTSIDTDNPDVISGQPKIDIYKENDVGKPHSLTMGDGKRLIREQFALALKITAASNQDAALSEVVATALDAGLEDVALEAASQMNFSTGRNELLNKVVARCISLGRVGCAFDAAEEVSSRTTADRAWSAIAIHCHGWARTTVFPVLKI